MIVKGIIKSIDYSGNTCTVRIPIFESAANENEVVISAILSTLPGIYNGYKEEDVVFIAFENNDYDMPVVIGKLYLGVENEKNDPRGAIVCNNITAAQPISIPISSKLTLDNDPQHSSVIGVDKGIDSYKSIADLAKNLQKQDEKIGSLSVKVIDDGENLGAEIAKKVSITDETTKQRGLGWNLNTEKWEIYAKDTVGDNGKIDKLPIMTIDRTGTIISGDLILTGYPQTTEIKYTNSTDKNTPPTGDDVKWQDNTNDLYTDKHYIWKRTREVFYAYNAETDKWELTKYGTAHYECITGAKGDPGYNTVTVMLYKRSKTSISGEQISTDLYYKFSDQKLYTDDGCADEYILPTGWSYTISGTGDSSNGDLYCIAAVAHSNTESDKILLNEWVGPTLYVENGADGKPGVYIKEVKQWYILKASSFPESGQKPEDIKPADNAEPTYNPAPTSTTLDEWMPTPPEAVNGYNIWTCYGSIFSDDIPSDSKKRHIEYSIPVKDNAYALAQGKNATYYDDTPPIYAKKIGDCWFDTGYVKIATTPTTKAGYLGKFIVLSDGTSVDNVIPVRAYDDDNTRYISSKVGPDYIVKITPDNINEINIKENTAAYETGNLKQWDGANWVDIAGELVTNKLTAKYINAMDITAKKITVLNNNNAEQSELNPILFEADGLSGNGTVTIADFTVGNNAYSTMGGPYIRYGNDFADNSILLSPGYKTANQSLTGDTTVRAWTITSGKNFGVTSNGDLYANSAHIKGDLRTAGYNIGDSSGIWISSTGVTSTASVGGSPSDTSNTWTIASGDDFGITSEGKIFTRYGKIGALELTPTTLSVGKRFYDNNSFLYLNTENNYAPTGWDDRASSAISTLEASSARFNVQILGLDIDSRGGNTVIYMDGRNGNDGGLVSVYQIQSGDLDNYQVRSRIPITKFEKIPISIGGEHSPFVFSGIENFSNKKYAPVRIILSGERAYPETDKWYDMSDLCKDHGIIIIDGVATSAIAGASDTILSGYSQIATAYYKNYDLSAFRRGTLSSDTPFPYSSLWVGLDGDGNKVSQISFIITGWAVPEFEH